MKPTLKYWAIAALLGGCQCSTSDPTPAPRLLDIHWALVQIDATPIAVSSYHDDSNSYIQFTAAGNRLQGLATCDVIQGQFALGTSSNQLTISQVSTIKGSCTSPFIGPQYLVALPQISRYEISGGMLRLYDAQAAQPRLVFQAAP